MTQPPLEPLEPANPSRRTGILVDEETRVVPTDEGDHERFAHYVRKDKILESAVEGTPVIALCGKVWVPNRDPGRFPVCPECKEIFESIPDRGDDDSSSSDG
jgi:hypothetical protein